MEAVPSRTVVPSRSSMDAAKRAEPRATDEERLLRAYEQEDEEALRKRLMDVGFDHKVIAAADEGVNSKRNFIGLLTQHIGEAAYHGNAMSVRRLLRNGWDPNDARTWYDGWPPLTCAAAGGYTEIMRAVLEAPKPAKTETATAMGYSALHAAAELRRTKAVKMLIEHRADVNQTAVNGSTPLYWAAMGGHMEAAQALVNAGADVHIASREGTALDAAQRRGHTDVVQLLLDTM